MVDEQVDLQRRTWDVRVGVKIGDILLGEDVLAQERASLTAAWRWLKLPTVPRNVTMPSSAESATASGSGILWSKISESRMAVSITASFMDMLAPRRGWLTRRTDGRARIVF